MCSAVNKLPALGVQIFRSLARARIDEKAFPTIRFQFSYVSAKIPKYECQILGILNILFRYQTHLASEF